MQSSDDENGWLTPYADLISAILATILVVFQQQEFAFEAELEKFIEHPSVELAAPSLVTHIDPLDDMYLELQSLVEEQQLTHYVRLEKDAFGFEISLDTVTLFAPGSANFEEQQLARYGDVFGLIASGAVKRHVDINGHTDDTGSSEQNWRLSAERALAMYRYLVSGFDISEAQVRLIAYADSKPVKQVLDLS